MATDSQNFADPDDVDTARARLAQQMVTPWWYKALSGLIVAGVIVGIGMTFDDFPFGGMSTGVALIVLALCTGPLMLRLLKSTTGVAIDRYGRAWTKVTFCSIAGLILALLAQQFLDWSWAMVVAAGLGFLVTVIFELWVDSRLRRGQLPARAAT